MTEKDAWHDGFEAALAGKPRENLNPWNAALHSAWLRGFDEGAATMMDTVNEVLAEVLAEEEGR